MGKALLFSGGIKSFVSIMLSLKTYLKLEMASRYELVVTRVLEEGWGGGY